MFSVRGQVNPRREDKEKKQMQKVLLMLLLFSACLSSCTKNTGVTSPAAVKAQAIIDDNIVAQYLKANGLTDTAHRIDTTGVYYMVNTAGSANSLYNSSTSVTVGFTGTLLTTGYVFEQTDTIHPSYVLGQVIRGWQLGIPKVGQGGTVTLYLPSRYAYGPFAQPNTGLPANAVLIFNITVYAVTN